MSAFINSEIFIDRLESGVWLRYILNCIKISNRDIWGDQMHCVHTTVQ